MKDLAMIEVEIKFKLFEEQKKQLLAEATFVSEDLIHDVYYDSSNYELTTKDFWLRKRNGNFMLKTPATQTDNRKIFSMHELTEESLIRQTLNLSSELTLEQAIENAGFKPLYKITNTRIKYTKDGIIIDIDHADYGDFTYDLCELETIVDHQEQIEKASLKLQNFATNHGIKIEPAEGKLIHLIKLTNPEHYAILQAARKI